jgi:hypothetical protein
MFSSFLFLRATRIFFQMDGNIFLRVSALQVFGQAGLKRIPSRQSVHSTPTKASGFRSRSVVSALAFPASMHFCLRRDFFWILDMVRGSSGGFPLRRKLTEFAAVIWCSVNFLSVCGNGSFGGI